MNARHDKCMHFCLHGDLIVLRRIDERKISIETYCEIQLKQDIVMSSYLENLSKHIVKLSVSEDFIVAKDEWELHHIRITKEFRKCPCGHAIKEHCYIRNRLNSQQQYDPRRKRMHQKVHENGYGQIVFWITKNQQKSNV